MRIIKYILCLSVLLLCNNTIAETSQAFSLESPLAGEVFGPFVLQDNFVADIGADKYLIKITSNGFLQLENIKSNKISEPYEFKQGRMIRINENLFTIVDVKEIPYVAPLPAPKPIVKPKPVVKPVVATAAPVAAIVPVAKPAKKAKENSTYKPVSAMWTTTTPEKKPKPKPRKTITTYKNPMPKSVKEPVPFFTPAKTEPVKVSKKPPYRPPSKHVPYRPKSSEPTRLRPHKGIAFSDRLGIAVDISVLEKVNYDYSLSNVDGSTDAEISRNSMAVKFKIMPFTLELGKVFRADWTGEVTGPNLPFQNLDLSNGSGWWWDIKYRHPLWTKESWLLSATADGSYRKEDYDLTYGEWVDTQVVLPPEGTNTEATVETIKDLAATTQAAIFTEKIFKLGLTLSYKADSWGCWAAADVIAYHSADIESKISTEQGDYTINVERTSPFILTFGASIKKAGVNWFSTVNLAGESAIRFGANYKF